MGALLGLMPLFNELIALFPTAEQRATAANKLQDVALQMAQMQTQIDANEASNNNMFVAGWRPAVGWICVLGFAYGIVGPLVHLPAIDTAMMTNLLYGMLGLGTLRTAEKVAKR